MRKIQLILLMVSALISSWVLAPGTIPFSITKAAPEYQENSTPQLFFDEVQTVYLTNLERRKIGIPPLRWNQELSEAARWFAHDSVENRATVYCGHVDTTGRSPGARFTDFGFIGMDAWSENVVCGYTNPNNAVQGWMRSNEHKANLLNPAYREIGLGYYRNSTTGRGYIVQELSNDPNYAPVIIENEAPSIATNQVNLYIYDPAVGAGLEGMGPAVEMMIANEPTFAQAVWEPFTKEKAWQLDAGEGWRTVYVKIRDAQGRTTLVSDAIYLGPQLPIETLNMDQASHVDNQVQVTNLEANGWSSVQLSLSWLGDNSDSTFELLFGSGEQVTDTLAIGGTAHRLIPGRYQTYARYWTSSFYKNTPLVAYFRLKVSDNSHNGEVLKISIDGGGAIAGPLLLRGTDFTATDQYQEFALPFSYQENPNQPFLTFEFHRLGPIDVFVDTVTIFTAPQPATPNMLWQPFDNYYRGRGIQARFTNADGAFSAAVEVNTQATPEAPPTPEPDVTPTPTEATPIATPAPTETPPTTTPIPPTDLSHTLFVPLMQR